MGCGASKAKDAVAEPTAKAPSAETKQEPAPTPVKEPIKQAPKKEKLKKDEQTQHPPEITQSFEQISRQPTRERADLRYVWYSVGAISGSSGLYMGMQREMYSGLYK